MKRGKIGLGFLAVLLVLCILTTAAMERWHAPLARTLGAAADLAAAGEWEEAKTLAGRARADWEKRWHLSAAFADHGPMEDIDSLFAQLEVYQKQTDVTNFAAACAELSRRVEAMGNAHSLTWWNLL